MLPAETATVDRATITARQETDYDVIIIGGGVTGTALLYVLANYTNVGRIALVEKYSELGQVNSHHHNNSQTLHFGDIETNYSLEKALKVRRAAELLAGFLENISGNHRVFRKTHKMVLGIGWKQVKLLADRFLEFMDHYPKLRMLDRIAIGQIEPCIVEGRSTKEPICAIATDDGCIVDYGLLAQEFVDKSCNGNGRTITILLETQVVKVNRLEFGYELILGSGEKITTRALAVNAGPYSLLFAKSLGLGLNLEILPVVGNFYYVDQEILRGKIYTVQIEGLPFAAIHGDPEIDNEQMTRFGPTARVMPLMERRQVRSFWDFWKTPVYNFAGLLSLLKISADWKIVKFMLGNFLYEVPLLGKWLFLKKARQIVPGLRYRDLKYGKGFGGIRPQVIDTKTKRMELAQARIIGDGAIFNITPSPGASVCLESAREEAEIIIQALGDKLVFDQEKFLKDHQRKGAN